MVCSREAPSNSRRFHMDFRKLRRLIDELTPSIRQGRESKKINPRKH
jgi:hypothetical protein